MNDPIISRFAEACGATAPLHLRVDLVDGGRRAEGTVEMPFTLVGRDDACDVTLTDPEVNPRHMWLQALGGRLLAVDLGSRIGLTWPGQGTGSGWLDVGVSVRIGPFQLRLCSPISQKPVHFPPRYSPLQSDPSVLNSNRTYNLEFRNGKRARDRWTVNRLVTLVGRAPECKIRLSADDIAAYHCGLVLTPSSLWVVDLSGRGVVVNGERMRVSELREGAELWIGRFLIGLQLRAGTIVTVRSTSVPAKSTATLRSTPPPASQPELPEDEVPLGIVPPRDPLAGLPSSHIMADAFQLWGAGTSGGVSNPILVSGSEQPQTPPSSPDHPYPAGGSKPKLHEPNNPVRDSTPGSAQRDNTSPNLETVAVLLRELGELHGQMLTQFEQSLGLLVRLFACLEPTQIPAMQRELARIQELNSELAHLQAERARRATDQSSTPPPRVVPATPTDSTAQHDWVADRIGTLQRERQVHWQSLVGMVSAVEGKGT